MITVVLLVVVAAFICTIASAISGRVPLWVAVLLLAIAMLLEHLPLK